MSRIFIDRPIFAWVIAIIIMLVGHRRDHRAADRAISRRRAAPGQHPRDLSRRVGRDAGEQRHPDPRAAAHRPRRAALFQLVLELARVRSTSTSMFDKGTDPDIAQVQVQNAIQAAISRLPQQVQQQGVRVTKSNPDFLMIVGVYDDDRHAHQRRRRRLAGDQHAGPDRRACPASATSTCSARNMRCASGSIRSKLASFQLMPSDVITAIQSQNTQVAAGEIGGLPQPDRPDAQRDGHRAVAAPDARPVPQHHRQDRSERRAACCSATSPGSSSAPRITTSIRGSTAIPARASAIILAPGADALKTAELVKAQGRAARRRHARRATNTPTPTTPPTSSSCRSTRS